MKHKACSFGIGATGFWTTLLQQLRATLHPRVISALKKHLAFCLAYSYWLLTFTTWGRPSTLGQVAMRHQHNGQKLALEQLCQRYYLHQLLHMEHKKKVYVYAASLVNPAAVV